MMSISTFLFLLEESSEEVITALSKACLLLCEYGPNSVGNPTPNRMFHNETADPRMPTLSGLSQNQN